MGALGRIPKDEGGEPKYEEVDAETAWDAILEQTEGDEGMAQSVVDSMVEDKRKALKEAEKSKAKQGGTISEKIRAEKERQAVIDKAKGDLEKWEEIAAERERRANVDKGVVADGEVEAKGEGEVKEGTEHKGEFEPKGEIEPKVEGAKEEVEPKTKAKEETVKGEIASKEEKSEPTGDTAKEEKSEPKVEKSEPMVEGEPKVKEAKEERGDEKAKGENGEGKVNEGKVDETTEEVEAKEGEVADKEEGKATDVQGNPLNEDGTLKLEKVASVDDLTDEDFSNPTRNVQLPKISENVDKAIGANGKPIVIKKNIFEKNWKAHKFPFDESRSILKAALYNTDLVGQTQPLKRPLHWVAIKVDEKSPLVVLEVNDGKDNVELVGWYTLDARNLDRIKRQAQKNGGDLVMLSAKDKVESLSTPHEELSLDGKGTIKEGEVQGNGGESDGETSSEVEDAEFKEFQRRYNEGLKAYEEHKAEQAEGLKGVIDDLKREGIDVGEHLADQTKRNINDDGFFVNGEGGTTVYHGTQRLDLKVEDLDFEHDRADGEKAGFNGRGVYFTPTDDNDYGNGRGEKLLSCKLKMSKPFYLVGNMALEDGLSSKKFSDVLLSHGYDGIIVYSSKTDVILNHDPMEMIALRREVIVPIEERGENGGKGKGEDGKANLIVGKDAVFKHLQKAVWGLKKAWLSGEGKEEAIEALKKAVEEVDKKEAAMCYLFSFYPKGRFEGKEYVGETLRVMREALGENGVEMVDGGKGVRVGDVVRCGGKDGQADDVVLGDVVFADRGSLTLDNGKRVSRRSVLGYGRLKEEEKSGRGEVKPMADGKGEEGKEKPMRGEAAADVSSKGEGKGGGKSVMEGKGEEAKGEKTEEGKVGAKGEKEVAAKEEEGKTASKGEGKVDGDVEGKGENVKGADGKGEVKTEGKEGKTEGKGEVAAEGEEKEKIDDVGEKIAGARKDMLSDLAKKFDEVTEESLVALPFAKAFKRPNLKEAVEKGALRVRDAHFAEAVMAAFCSRPKPRLLKGWKARSSEMEVKRWARDVCNGVELMKMLMNSDEATRDKIIEAALSKKVYSDEEVEMRKRDLEEWNNGKKFTGTCYPINPLKFFMDVYEGLGYGNVGEVKLPISGAVPAMGFSSYDLMGVNGKKIYLRSDMTSYEDVVREAVYLTKLFYGDADTDHPTSKFRVRGVDPVFETKGWMVNKVEMKGRRQTVVTEHFKTREEAEKYIEEFEKNVDKGKGYVSRPIEERERTGWGGYEVSLRNDWTDGYVDTGLKYDTMEEARAAIDAEHERLNEIVNGKIREEMEKEGEKSGRGKRDYVNVVYYTETGMEGYRYGVVLDEKYAPRKKSAWNTMPYMLAKGFKTREEAEKYIEAHREELDKMVEDVKKRRREFVYFGGNGEVRVGEDYRRGRDVSAEELREQFGFRGVQFGNWTNQRDRQAAVNNAFDALMDLSRVLGVSPKALSLNGELGLAFGARGSGGAAAHYEPGEVVINLTKTNGAGALAHEWWHALDNYFARRGNVKLGMVTNSKGIKMREELREAFNALIDGVEKSDFHKRSNERGESYWGTRHEETARLFEMWVGDELRKRGEANVFLTSSDANAEERYAKMNYGIYKSFAEMGDEEVMSYEDFRKTPTALNGFVYPTRGELETMGLRVRKIFDIIQERTEEATGNVVMYHRGKVVVGGKGKVETALMNAVIGLQRGMGLRVVTDVDEGQGVLDLLRGGVRMSAKKRRALETASVSQSEEHQPTVVSSATGAKVLKELESVKEKYEKNSNQSKTFIGDVARALGCERRGSASEYATFETKNGRIVTIRLANHNAKVSNFDNRGEADGISIVVSAKRGSGIENDGEAHIVEYYYDAIRLRRAEGKPLAGIVGSIEQALYSGEYKDVTGLAERQEVNGGDVVRYHKVYHGSGVDFDKVRFFKTEDGEVYGFTDGKSIYIDPSVATSETPIHEYAHLWATALRKGNVKEWGNVVGLMKGTKVWDEVREKYPELKGETEVAEEVIAMYSGRRGAERLREEMKRAMESDGSLSERAAAVGALGRVKRALEKFWKGVADFLGIHYRSAEEVADRVMKDMLSGVDPRWVGVDERVREQIVGERGAERMDGAEHGRERADDLMVAREMEREGRDAKTIKLATGWERGRDGKWRYEVEALRAKGGDVVKRYREVVDGKRGDVEKAEKRLAEVKAEIGALNERMDELEKKEGGLSEEEERKLREMNDRFDEACNEMEGLMNEVKGGKTATLGELCEESEVFKAYPELRDVKVEIGDAKGSIGYYLSGANKIVLSEDRLELADACLVHEVQHAIQEMEGFEGGGDIKTGERIARERNGLTEMQRTFVDDVRMYDEMMTDESGRKGYPLSAFIRDNIRDGMYDEDYARDLGMMSDGELRAEAERLMAMEGERLDGFEAYSRIAGEVEARNAETRMGMGMEEKRRSLLEDTEDVERGKQILLSGETAKNNESSTSNRTASELGQPTRKGAALATFTAKVDKNAERSKSLKNILQKIVKKNGLGAHELLHEIGKALGSKGQSTDRSEYFDLGDGRTLRLSNHQGDANTFARNGKKGGNYGVVIKLSKSRFKSRGDVDYAEFVYYGDKIVDGERQKALVNGIERFVRTGEVDDMPMPDKLNTSGEYGKLLRVGDGKRVEEGMKRMHEDWGKQVGDMVSSLGVGDRVEVVESGDGLEGEKRDAKGWFDTKTGRVVVVLDRHRSMEDVMRTVLHEVVAHYGLRRMVGGERMNGMLDGVFARLDEETRRKVAGEAKGHGWDVRVATEEYLASLAEDGRFEEARRKGVWERVKGIVGDVLRGLGWKKGALDDNELRYLLWRSYEGLRGGEKRGLLDRAEDVALQWRLGVGNFRKEKPLTLREKRNVEESVLYREDRDRVMARDDYDRMVGEAKHRMNLAWADSMSGLKLLQESIERNGGGKLKEWEDAYMAENRMSSKSMAEMEAYRGSFYKDLIDAVDGLTSGGRTTYEGVVEYMVAKHGLERNVVFARRDARRMAEGEVGKKVKELQTVVNSKRSSADDVKRAEDGIREAEALLVGVKNGLSEAEALEWYNKRWRALDKALGDGKLTREKYDEKLMELNTLYNEGLGEVYFPRFRDRDYSGLTALTGEEDVADAEAAAWKMVGAFEGENDTMELWRATNAATNASLDKEYECGLLTREERDYLKGMFDYYVPLQGFEEVTSDEVYRYMDNRNGRMGGVIRRAKGRRSLADDPIATIGNNAARSIMMGNRNDMKMHFLRMVLNHPSDAVSVNKLYLRYDGVKDEWVPQFADIRDGASSDEVKMEVEAFNKKMEQLCKTQPDEYKEAGEKESVPYRVVGANIGEIYDNLQFVLYN